MFVDYRDKIDSICSRYKYKTAYKCLFDDEIKALTFDQVYTQINKFKTLIDKYNLKPADRVGLIYHNSFYAQLAFIYFSYYNITVVLIDSMLPNESMKSLIDTSDIRLLLTEKEIYKNIDSSINFKALDITNEFSELNDYDLKDMSIKGDDDALTIIFSSGTSSSFKPVVVGYDAALNTRRIISENNKLNSEDVMLLAFPITHISGFMSFMIMFLSGRTICTTAKLNLNDLPKLMNIFNPTIFGMAPRVLEVMMEKLEQGIKEKGDAEYSYYLWAKKASAYLQKKAGNRDVGNMLLKPYSKQLFGSNMKYIYTGSTKCKDSIAESISDLGITWVNFYASTECGCPIVSTSIADRHIIDSEGKVDLNPDITIKINNPDENGVGEIYVKSCLMMKYYFNDEKLTKEAFDDGFFKTGDLGYIDSNNYLHVKGRMKDSIQLSTGKKIAPFDLETLLEKACPKDNKVIICGLPVNDSGYDEIHAFFKDNNYSNKEKERIVKELLEYSKKRAGLYPIKDVHFVREIPKTTIQKVKKEELIKMINEKERPVYTYENKKMAFLAGLIDKYTTINEPLKEEMLLSQLGLDSLAIVSISTELYGKYHIDITEKINIDTTIGDVIKLIGSKSQEKDELVITKIDPKDIKEIAYKIAECFKDYELYDIYFPHDEKRVDRIACICWYNFYLRQNFAYTDQDKSLFFTLKKPTDKQLPFIKLLFTNFTIAFIKAMGVKYTIRTIKIFNEYNKAEEQLTSKYYNPKTDNWIGTFAVTSQYRSSGAFFKVLSQMDDGNPVYAETQSEKNANLYDKMGAKIVGTINWRNTTIYACKREATKKD